MSEEEIYASLFIISSAVIALMLSLADECNSTKEDNENG